MSFTHPRRTTKSTSSALTPTSNASGRPVVNANMSLRKGATFHSPPSSPESEAPYHFRVPSLPRRAHTTLEDVVDAHKRRVALTLGNIDRSLASLEEPSPTSRQSFRDESSPVPQGFLNHTVTSPSTRSYSPTMDGVMGSEPSGIGRHSLRQRPNRRSAHNHASDSGLGSSIMSASEKLDASSVHGDDHCAKSIVAASAITRSAAVTSNGESLPRLSARASNRIHEYILKPLLAKSSLKDFHPIVKDCPRRIHGKEIVCLRDLEKTLIFMAPVSETQDDVAGGVAHWYVRLKERTKTAKLYLDFCLTSIRCIQATVEFLSEREQTRPHDRPYTNGYFVDLVDQIKQYAQQVQSSKEKEAKGEKLDEMDANSYVPLKSASSLVRFREPHRVTQTHQANAISFLQISRALANPVDHRTDEIRLHGGLTKNGRPAELVRVRKDGKAISIATGKPIESLEEDSKSALKMKRSMSEEAEDDESIMRSMARRKRSASAAELAPKRCREPGCDKEFKRPCDLTKHEKTHSRPWKCPVETCKYHEYGWPTEKEMDRHHNDKHSAAPAMYECHFKPCSYKSKRESNCKQHMEKAHGWEYVRSKNNGKATKRESNGSSVSGALPTPQMTNMQTPSSDGHGVNTPEEEDFDMGSGFDGAVMFDQHLTNDTLIFPPYNQDLDIFVPQPMFDFSPISDNNQSLGSSNDSPFMGSGMPDNNTFQDFNGNSVDFNLFGDEDLYNAHVQLPTPDPSVFQQALGQFDTSGIPYQSNPVPHISPVGHGNHMLYSPTSLREVDEGFEDFVPNNTHIGPDFQLFPSGCGSGPSSSANSGLFGEIPSMNHNNLNANLPPLAGMTAQELLNYYTAVTSQVGVPNGGMEWSSDDQYSGYNNQGHR
ncbi:putative zinc finger transcription factor ace1 [Coleophoma crateriformis]|uniref:Putative zinc finger transcription factor ace1 n=1 Tax=Coleophoma crateriformis TaxID=565419 RepID=A0A3D8T9R6_9HELO|nr:putative zinc finger transcription factor ace1 [Coleophoma crateriformis]